MLENLTDKLATDSIKARIQRARHDVHVARLDGAARLFDLGTDSLSRAQDFLKEAPDSLAPVTRSLQGLVDGGLEQVTRVSIEGYDEMNVRQIDDAVRGLGVVELARVERRELAGKNRKTVLRAIERERSRLRSEPIEA